jgi:hypothetical protein
MLPTTARDRPVLAIRGLSIPDERGCAVADGLHRDVAEVCGCAVNAHAGESVSGQSPLGAADGWSPLAKTPYDLRHVAVSRWLAAGVPVTKVAEWAAHSVEVLLKAARVRPLWTV